MSITRTENVFGETAAYGGFIDAAGGVATVVLAIVGLTGAATESMVAIATVVFGAALLMQGGTTLSEYASLMFSAGAVESSAGRFGGGSLSVVFLAGAAGIVLGILALLGVSSTALTAAAIIAFGVAFVLSSNSIGRLQQLKHASLTGREALPVSGAEILASEMAHGSAAMQALSGLAAIVLGILALAGGKAEVLSLVALLALGGALILTGSTLSATVMGFMRPIAPRSVTESQPRAAE
jgi:hypothetical protein